MRFIKLFLVGLIGLSVVVTLLSLLLPSEVKSSHAVIINATPGKIYPQISNLKNWKNWQPMFASDSAVIVFSDSPMGSNKGCLITYKGREVHLTITAMDSSAIKFLLQSKGEDEIQNTISLTPVKAENSIRVEWQAVTKLHWYPWDKFYGIFVDKITGPGYEESLNNLKKFIEINP